jgi:DNA polymerase
VKTSRSVADALRYLADLGWEDLYRSPPGGRAAAAAVAATPPGPDEAPPAARPGLDELAAQAEACTRCRLADTRQRVVFGSGDPRARLMLVGEGPGAEEDRRGLPFVGRAGELLNKILAAIGLRREEVYIANVVKCRPPGNREPQPDEIASCRGYLEAQIDTVRPEVLVCLGRVAAQTLLGNNAAIGRTRGQWFKVRGIDTMVTYHPAALLRNESLKRPTWEDMQRVRDRLGEPGAAR